MPRPRAYTLLIGTSGPFAAAALSVDASGNRVFEPGESVTVAPAWHNGTGATATVTGTAGTFTGPGGSLYAIVDGTADYGTVAPGATASCASTGNCYRFGVFVPIPRPALHWDSTFLETLSNGNSSGWTLHVGGSFADVPAASGFYRFVETLLHRGVTGGCGPAAYCPVSPVTREQMAVFVLVAREGPGYAPPPAALPCSRTCPRPAPSAPGSRSWPGAAWWAAAAAAITVPWRRPRGTRCRSSCSARWIPG